MSRTRRLKADVFVPSPTIHTKSIPYMPIYCRYEKGGRRFLSSPSPEGDEYPRRLFVLWN